MLNGTCGHCGKCFAYEESAVGQQGPCPHCGALVKFPEPAPAAPPAALPAAGPASPASQPGPGARPGSPAVGSRTPKAGVGPRRKVSWAKPYDSGLLRANLVSGALLLCILLDLVALVSGYAQIRLLRRLALGEALAPADIEANDARQGMIGFAQVGCFVLMLVLLMMWVHRAYRNLPSLGASRLESSPGWAVGYFFIPILCLFRPCQIVLEIWSYSAPAAAGSDFRSRKGQSSALVVVWWVLWIVSAIVGRVSDGMFSRGKDADSLITATWASLVADVVAIALAGMTLLVVRSSQARQDQKHLANLAALETRETAQADTAAG